MKAGKYTVRELFVNSYIDQIVIPEIQRDYVWGEEPVNGLLKSILDDYNEFCDCTIPVQTGDEEFKILFMDFYKKQKYSSNIGFIYAYNDPEYAGKYFLIDGQQRITTIYLLLLALSVRTDKTVFEKYYFSDKILKVDYRVREAAHLFLDQFVNYILDKGNPLEEIVSKQYWYFTSNDLDPTITSIVRNYNLINDFLAEKITDYSGFLNYVQHYIEFWYFDTNLSDQGEDLYIYMNARGEQIQPNENLKADLIATLKTQNEKNEWGLKWESWQDFFWQNRGENENADTGFNEFINCIAGLEFYKRKLDDKNYDNQLLNELLSLPLIERYMQTLQFLKSEKEAFISKYSYAGWVNKYYNLIWNFLNKSIKRNTNWFADFRDKNKNDDRNSMVLMWSFFYYSSIKENKINSDEFFRVMRFFYIRFHNYNRSVSTLQNTLNLISINKVVDKIELQLGTQDDSPDEETDTKYRTDEEKGKYQFLAQFIDSPEILRQYESLIWEIEDHPYNLDGSYLGNINITHLVDFNTNPSIDELKKIKDRFYLILSFADGGEKKTLINTLLHFGTFWHRDSPWYYYNFKFDNWRNIIRDKNSEVKTFREFFTDYLGLEKPLPLQEILDSKNRDFLKRHLEDLFIITDFRLQLIVYSILHEDMWGAGYHMCYDENNKARFFDIENAIFNSKRYRDGAWFYLWETCLKKYGSREAMKNYLEQYLKTKENI